MHSRHGSDLEFFADICGIQQKKRKENAIYQFVSTSVISGQKLYWYSDQLKPQEV